MEVVCARLERCLGDMDRCGDDLEGGLYAMLMSRHDVALEVMFSQVGSGGALLRLRDAFERRSMAALVQTPGAVRELAPLGFELSAPVVSLGKTPLMLAIERGDIPLIRELIAAGVDPEAVGFSGQTAVFCAVACGRFTVYQDVLRSGVRLDVTDARDCGVVYRALEALANEPYSIGQLAICEDILCHPDVDLQRVELQSKQMNILFGELRRSHAASVIAPVEALLEVRRETQRQTSVSTDTAGVVASSFDEAVVAPLTGTKASKLSF